MVIGNHEPDFGTGALHQIEEILKLPIIACNVKGPEVDQLNIHPYVIIPIDNNDHHHLCVVGVTARELYPFIKNLRVESEIDSVLGTLRILRNQTSCDRVVILSHAGIDFDTELSNKLASLRRTETILPVVDAILGGHSHVIMSTNKYDFVATLAEGRPLLLHTGAHGRHVGLLRLIWNVTSNSLVNAQSEILPLDEAHGVYPDDIYVSDLVSRKRVMDAADFLLMKQKPNESKITLMDEKMEGSGDEHRHQCSKSCRLGDCVLGQIITDAMRFCVYSGHCLNDSKIKQEHTIALLESGTVRNCFDPQKQTFDNILPWPNNLVILRVTGAVILKMIQHGLSTKESSTRGGGFLQVSGLKYNYTEDNQLMEKSICFDKNIGIYDKSTSALEWDETYTVVVTDWLAAGGDGFGDFMKDAISVLQSKVLITDAISFYREKTDADKLKYSTSSQFSRSFLVLENQSSAHGTRKSGIAAIAGFVGGAISYILTYPLYALFIRKAAASSIRSSAKLSGWELFDGVWLGTLATALTNGIYFLIYDLNYLAQYSNWTRSFVAAISNSVLTTPLWVVITWQHAYEKRGSLIAETARKIYNVRGLSGFFDSLPFNCILCIFPILRQVTYEMILQNSIVSISVGTAGMIASIVPTIITYPMQKLRFVWHLSPHRAMNEANLGLLSITTCSMPGLYETFVAGIGYKLADTCIRNFFLFFTMDLIEELLKSFFGVKI